MDFLWVSRRGRMKIEEQLKVLHAMVQPDHPQPTCKQILLRQQATVSAHETGPDVFLSVAQGPKDGTGSRQIVLAKRNR